MNRNKTKYVIGRMFSAVLLCFVILAMNIVGVNATELVLAADTVNLAENTVLSNPLIVVERYEVSGERIVPGEDFSLKLILKNYNAVKDATGVLVDISNPSGVAPVYGTVSQVYIGDIKAGESKEIELEYNSSTKIVDETLNFNVTIVTDSNENYVVMTVPVGADSPFNIVSASVPSEVKKGEYVNISLAFKVIGEDRVKDVVLTASANGEVIGSSQIGIINPGVTKTQQLLLSFDNVGEHVMDLNLEYVDDAGQKKGVLVGTAIIDVYEDMPEDVVPTIPENNNDGMEAVLLMGVSGMLILVIFLVVIIILKKNR